MNRHELRDARKVVLIVQRVAVRNRPTARDLRTKRQGVCRRTRSQERGA